MVEKMLTTFNQTDEKHKTFFFFGNSVHKHNEKHITPLIFRGLQHYTQKMFSFTSYNSVCNIIMLSKLCNNLRSTFTTDTGLLIQLAHTYYPTFFFFFSREHFPSLRCMENLSEVHHKTFYIEQWVLASCLCY
jgi:hypothetical protein